MSLHFYKIKTSLDKIRTGGTYIFFFLFLLPIQPYASIQPEIIERTLKSFGKPLRSLDSLNFSEVARRIARAIRAIRGRNDRYVHTPCREIESALRRDKPLLIYYVTIDDN